MFHQDLSFRLVLQRNDDGSENGKQDDSAEAGQEQPFVTKSCGKQITRTPRQGMIFAPYQHKLRFRFPIEIGVFHNSLLVSSLEGGADADSRVGHKWPDL